MSFNDAFLKIRSYSIEDIIDGINTLNVLKSKDVYNMPEYIYNIAYGYYRLNIMDKFYDIYAENYFGDNEKLNFLYRKIEKTKTVKSKDNNSLVTQNLIKITYSLLGTSIILWAISLIKN